MTTHFSILAWEILWTEEPGWLQSMGSQGSDTNHHHIFIQLSKGFAGVTSGKEHTVRDAGSIPGLGRFPGEGNTIHSSILATVHGVAKSWT